MNRMTLLQRTTGIGLVLLFVVGCSAPATPTLTPTPIPPTATSTPIPPTATSTPIPSTPTPTPRPGPKAGHWEGEPSVSFDVTTDGVIHNLSMTVLFGKNNIGLDRTCKITLKVINVEADGTFIFTEWVENTDTLRAFIDLGATMGIPTPEATQTASGEMIAGTIISGKFNSATTLSGTYIVRTCEGGINISDSQPTWSAEWKTP